MKFRRLSIEELKELEGEFIQFLAANTITGPDWEQLKKQEPAKAENLLDMFSNIVFEKIVKGIAYMEYKIKDDIKTFHCLPDKIIMNGLRIEGETEVDLRTNIPPQELMQQVHEAGAKMQIYSAEKAYKPDREQELFRMLEGGAQISRDGMLFKAIEEFKKQ